MRGFLSFVSIFFLFTGCGWLEGGNAHDKYLHAPMSMPIEAIEAIEECVDKCGTLKNLSPQSMQLCELGLEAVPRMVAGQEVNKVWAICSNGAVTLYARTICDVSRQANHVMSDVELSCTYKRGSRVGLMARP